MVLDYHDSFSEVSKIKSIKIVDNDTIYIEGNNKLTGEYKRIKDN